MSAPYLTICILCVLLGIAFLYRFCLVFQSSREGYETGASKTIGSREIQMDYYTIEENENGLLAVLADGMGKEAGGRIAAKTVIRVFKEIFGTKNEILNSTTTFGGGIYSRTVKVYSFI